MEGIAEDKMKFKLRFENPTSVSIGLRNDVIIARILDESFFCSNDSPLSIDKGTEIRTVLPRMLSSEEMVTALDTTSS